MTTQATKSDVKQTRYISKNKPRTKTASSTLESSPSHCLIFIRRSLRRSNPLTPRVFAHFLSTWSTPASSLLSRQTMERHSRRMHKPLKRTQNDAQAIREIPLVQIISLAGLPDIDNNVRDSSKLVHHYVTLFLALLHFLVSQFAIIRIRHHWEGIMNDLHPAWQALGVTGQRQGR